MNDTARRVLRGSVMTQRVELRKAIKEVDTLREQLNDARALYERIKREITDLQDAAGDPIDIDPTMGTPPWDTTAEPGELLLEVPLYPGQSGRDETLRLEANITGLYLTRPESITPPVCIPPGRELVVRIARTHLLQVELLPPK